MLHTWILLIPSTTGIRALYWSMQLKFSKFLKNYSSPVSTRIAPFQREGWNQEKQEKGLNNATNAQSNDILQGHDEAGLSPCGCRAKSQLFLVFCIIDYCFCVSWKNRKGFFILWSMLWRPSIAHIGKNDRPKAWSFSLGYHVTRISRSQVSLVEFTRRYKKQENPLESISLDSSGIKALSPPPKNTLTTVMSKDVGQIFGKRKYENHISRMKKLGSSRLLDCSTSSIVEEL